MNETVNTPHTDIKRDHPFVAWLPPRFRVYGYLMRLDRPAGIYLLLLPCLWGLVMGAGGLAGFGPWECALVPLMMAGAVIMRGAGCVINDLWDRDIDPHVERTRARPLASGEVSIRQTVLFLAGLLFVGLAILLTLPPASIFYGFVAAALVVVYPLAKRVTWWPQLVLGLTFNMGVPIAWAAAGDVNGAAALMYAGAVLWTLGYDTVYAHQDIEDDAKIGVKSTARLFGARARAAVAVCYGGATLLWAAAMAWQASSWAGAVPALLAGAHFMWQLAVWRPDDPASSLAVFKMNAAAGLVVLAACAIAFCL